jgi:hypothetical protein
VLKGTPFIPGSVCWIDVSSTDPVCHARILPADLAAGSARIDDPYDD